MTGASTEVGAGPDRRQSPTDPPSTDRASSEPLVSVITNSYNSRQYLARNIDSMLAQDYQNWEHLIIDCGSTDGSAELVESMGHLRLRLIRAPFCGVSHGRNLGLAQAHGDLFAILDSDDVCRPDRISTQVAALARQPSAVATGSGILWVDERTGARREYQYTEQTLDLLLRVGFNPIPHSSLMVRRWAVEAVGAYSEVLEKSEDFEFLLRLRHCGPLLSIAAPLVQYTRHSATHTELHRPQGRDYAHYVVLSLIMDAWRTGMPDVEKIHCWLDAVGPDGIGAMRGRWALRELRTNAFKLDRWTARYLLSVSARNTLAVIRNRSRKWWSVAASPSSIATHLVEPYTERARA